MFIDANQTIRGGRLPYERCLIPNLPQELQHHMRDIANFIFIPVGLLLAVLSFMVNFFLLIIIFRTRTLQHAPQLLLCSLSITDLMWGLFCVVKNVARITEENKCLERSDQDDFFFALGYFSTLGNLAVISRDRYIAVNRPWWYRTHVTRTRVTIQAVAVWLLSVVAALDAFLSVNSLLGHSVILIIYHATSSLFYLICILIMLFSYVGILRAGGRHKRHMLRLGSRSHTRYVWEREKRLASTVTSILFVLVFTLLPALILPYVLILIGFDVNHFPAIDPFYEVLVSISGLLNPLINFGRNKDVREAFRNLIGCRQWGRQIAPSTVVVVEMNEQSLR